jgi:hypothetical protein
LFFHFTVIFQLYYSSPALLLVSSFTSILQLYCCSPAFPLFSSLLLFSSLTVVLELS